MAATTPTIKPVIFKQGDHAIQAILRGDKTMMRQIINPQPPSPQGTFPSAWKYHYWAGSPFKDGQKIDPPRHELIDGMGKAFTLTPPYIVGDILYVKETWQQECEPCEDKEAGFKGFQFTGKYVYRADGYKLPSKEDTVSFSKWHPPLHMPEHAARLYLRITNIKAERLQNIEHAEAVAEGIEREWDGMHHWYKDYFDGDGGMVKDPIHSFMTLWQSICGIGTWQQNDWLWCNSFEKIKQPNL